MSNVKFIICTIKREKEIVRLVKKNIDFLKGNKIRFTFPQTTVEEEYDLKKYREYKKWLEKEWLKKEKGFVERLKTFFYQPRNLKFTVEISNYGPLGFYNSYHKTVTINLNTHLDVIHTIKHEMVHIMLEPFVQKYHIKHNDKETIVNTILKILE